MDFTLNEVQADIKSLANKIVGEQVTRERLKELEAGTERMDRGLWGELAKANLLGIALPESVGGSGYGIMELCVVLQEVGRFVAPIPLLATVAMTALPIAEFGTDDQQQKYLPAVVNGDSVLTAALQEPLNGSPLTPATNAKRNGDGWVLDGTKTAVPWAPLAERILVNASTGDGNVGLFLVDPSDPGVSLLKAEATNREPQAVLTLSGVRVADADVIGDPTNGTAAIQWVYRRALAGLCATAVGVAEEAVRITAEYISQREQFERPLATFQGATLRIADAYIDTQAINVATWSAIWRLAEGRPADDELAIAKYWVADGGHRVVHACQHLHGGMGVDIDYPIHRYLLWGKELELTLGGATPQLLRLGASMAGAVA
ncbi:MAG: acyl-CoA/acyl-ACP dehydrogenase [Actinobacteria bacterium]|nr:acyl-CoA/acyl-ACP dehydrogenase [Actinomycetota bacterium]